MTMKFDRLFMDSAYVLALLNESDQHHSLASKFHPDVRKAKEVWLTEAVLLEIGNGLARYGRDRAANFIRACYSAPNMQIVTVDSMLLHRALDLYKSRHDKTWGLIDCISFVVMQEQNLTDALTSDEHFIQAGFRALMLT